MAALAAWTSSMLRENAAHSRQTQLHSRREILKYAAPVTLVICSTPVALVDHNEIEEVWRIVTKIRRWIALCVTT